MTLHPVTILLAPDNSETKAAMPSAICLYSDFSTCLKICFKAVSVWGSCISSGCHVLFSFSSYKFPHLWWLFHNISLWRIQATWMGWSPVWICCPSWWCLACPSALLVLYLLLNHPDAGIDRITRAKVEYSGLALGKGSSCRSRRAACPVVAHGQEWT